MEKFVRLKRDSYGYLEGDIAKVIGTDRDGDIVVFVPNRISSSNLAPNVFYPKSWTEELTTTELEEMQMFFGCADKKAAVKKIEKPRFFHCSKKLKMNNGSTSFQKDKVYKYVKEVYKGVCLIDEDNDEHSVSQAGWLKHFTEITFQ